MLIEIWGLPEPPCWSNSLRASEIISPDNGDLPSREETLIATNSSAVPSLSNGLKPHKNFILAGKRFLTLLSANNALTFPVSFIDE